MSKSCFLKNGYVEEKKSHFNESGITRINIDLKTPHRNITEELFY